MQAAFRLHADEGIRRLEKQAQWLEREYPSAAASLREGLGELFTVNRLGLSPTLSRCLTTTNLIESPHSGVRLRTGRVTHWKDGAMVLRWAATAFHFRPAGYPAPPRPRSCDFPIASTTAWGGRRSAWESASYPPDER